MFENKLAWRKLKERFGMDIYRTYSVGVIRGLKASTTIFPVFLVPRYSDANDLSVRMQHPFIEGAGFRSTVLGCRDNDTKNREYVKTQLTLAAVPPSD